MPPWTRFSLTFLATSVMSALTLWIFILVADPYDTGRFAAFGERPLATVPARMAIASLGRRERFNAAIVGNSHVAPLSPERLSQSTGLDFVALTLAGASVAPKLQALKWFLTHRKAPPKLIVIGVDDVWCRSVPRYVEEPPLPTWLLSASSADYALKMFRYDSLEHALHRFTAPRRTSARPPDPRGFWNLELDHQWDGEKVAEQLSRPWTSTINLTGHYPALTMLSETLTSAPPDTAVALIMLPVWAGILPKAGQELASEQACKGAFERFSKSRPTGIFIDARRATIQTEDPSNFFDRTHYREPIAKEVEAELVRRLGAISGPH